MLMLNTSRRSVRDWKAEQAAGRFHPAGDCMAPIGVHARGDPDAITVRIGTERDTPAFIKYDIRCRKCEACLAHRARLWTARAIDELRASSRSWFGTLTVAPHERVKLLYRAQLQSKHWADLEQPEQFRALVAQCSMELTKFLKRVRKNSEAKLRYLLVTEAHADGFPHFHMLVHEHMDAVTKRTLEAAWPIGFTQWRLVRREDTGSARYVCKYLSKSALTRVRASQSYGQSSLLSGLVAERLLVVNRAVIEAREKCAVSSRAPNILGAVETLSSVKPEDFYG